MDEDQIQEFMAITATSEAVARHMIEMCGDANQAVTMWFSDPDMQRTIIRSVNDAQSASASNQPSRGRQDAEGVIHIDDSDDDMQDTGFDSDTEDVAGVARAAQEDEDAAMARRLQEELYNPSGSGAGPAAGGLDDDGVRAPMARTTEVLVAPGGYEDDEHEGVLAQIRARREQERAAARRRAGANNPFAQSVWADAGPAAAPRSVGAATSRAGRLAELFRPPYEIISTFSWDEARDEGKEEKKWILVNLQDSSDFNCQTLNRDVWKDAAIVALVKENFIFLQYDKHDPSAERYINFYFPNRTHENPSNYPHVSVVDPRTGEQVKVWSGSPFPSPSDFHSQLVEFLDRYSLAANSKNPVTKAKRKEPAIDFDKLTEEQQLELALQNSLDAAGGGASPPSNITDPDALTHSTGNLGEVDKGKGKAEEQPKAEAEKPQSAFSKIPADKPHTEPPVDPKTTTRIQIRHSNGRTIRRFGLDEPVSRIYEWIKAESPLPGMQGIDFELKTSPSGVDLIDLLDQTIQDAGLANGTVMLEYGF
ncbi:hypothetical protein QBC40DRAFT_75826 [Triangularia verruculosa]|uniref:UBX domain-containing protein n=1 Tax=Triangularia verruculosa TaxID=2587418 RepID=A0AAN6XLM5_9PEZI|nr:hypothetical protein QBC40DRAFT_75826 [Triangularia verruculosa]